MIDRWTDIEEIKTLRADYRAEVDRLRANIAELQSWHEEWKLIDAQHRESASNQLFEIIHLNARIAELEEALDSVMQQTDCDIATMPEHNWIRAIRQTALAALEKKT